MLFIEYNTCVHVYERAGPLFPFDTGSFALHPIHTRETIKLKQNNFEHRTIM